MLDLISNNAEGLQVIGGLLLALTLVTHIAFGLAIVGDATRRQSGGMHLAFVGPAIWGIATFGTGLVAVGLYWLMHYSNLTRGESGHVEVEVGPIPD